MGKKSFSWSLNVNLVVQPSLSLPVLHFACLHLPASIKTEMTEIMMHVAWERESGVRLNTAHVVKAIFPSFGIDWALVAFFLVPEDKGDPLDPPLSYPRDHGRHTCKKPCGMGTAVKRGTGKDCHSSILC